MNPLSTLNDTANTWHDPDDAPELTDDFFQHANLYDGEKMIDQAWPTALARTQEIPDGSL